MVIEYVKEYERLVFRLLLGAAGVLAILTVAKLWHYHSTTAKAQNIVSKAIEKDEDDPNLLRANLADSRKIADAIKKENVTPSGIPASTKPIKSGTEEQEQKGVTAPSVTAMPRACQSGRLRTYSRTRSGERSARSNPMM